MRPENRSPRNRVRLAAEPDLPVIKNLIAGCNAQVTHNMLFDQKNAEDLIYVVEDLVENVIVGFVYAQKLSNVPNTYIYDSSPPIHVLSIVVGPQYQERGFGLALIDYLKHFQRNLVMEIPKTNHKAIALAMRAGFHMQELFYARDRYKYVWYSK